MRFNITPNHPLTIAWVLLSVADGNATYVKSEQIVTAGRLDMVVFAESLQVGGSQRMEAYVWELKAPQLEMFEAKTKSLAQPSPHLYGAETQLMHYFYSIVNNPMLLRRWSISPDHVKFGGIIIGRDGNFVNHKLKDIDETEGTDMSNIVKLATAIHPPVKNRKFQLSRTLTETEPFKRRLNY